jgi:putative ABC transport system permease protein
MAARRQLLRTRLRTLFWRPPLEQEVDDELAHHVELQTRRFMSQGMSRAAARAAALERFGSFAHVRDTCHTLAREMEHDMHRRELLEELRQDLGYAWRVLRKAPVFTAIAVATLAIGIGANTAIFGVVHAVLLRALPYREAARAVVFWNQYLQSGTPSHTAIAPGEFADIVEQQRSFDQLAAISRQQGNLTGTCAAAAACDPERVTGYAVSPNLFQLLGVNPQLGRGFRPDDGAAAAGAVVLLSHSLWMRRFGGDASIVGRTVTFGGRPRTVIGVMPPEVRFPDAPVGFLRERGDLWVPHSWERSRGESRGNQYLGMVATLRDGVSLDEARRDVDLIAARFRREYASRYASPQIGWSIAVLPLRDQMVGDTRRSLFLVSGAVGLVLLIACANVANLTLARGASRRREMAVRTALGARRGRLVRQLLAESVLVALTGGGLGVLLAMAGTRGLVALDPGSIPRLDDARIDPGVLFFSLALSLVTGLLVGLAPAWRQSQAQLRDGLKEGGRRVGASQPRRRLRSLLVVGEVAMALVVLVGAGLLLRSFTALQRVDTGFDSANVLTFQLTLPRTKYDSAYKFVAFHRQLQQRLASSPGVEFASGVDPLPMGGSGWGATFVVAGRALAPGEPLPHAEHAVALPGYFRAMGIPLREGREFTDRDTYGAPEVVIVDEVLARQHWPRESAIGKYVRGGANEEGPGAQVIGIVGHVHNSGPRVEGEAQLYFPFLQRIQTPLSYVLRTPGDPMALLGTVRSAVRDIDADMPVARVATLSALETRALARERFNTLLLVLFAGTALALAAIGLYGVMAYLVTQRVEEIGIRLALGGRPRDVLRLVVGEGMLMALAGIAVGVACALALSRVVSGLLYGVRPTDPPTYVTIAALLCIVALVASVVPARRAARVDPAVALRS